eukprot:scaffold926_cov408-Prasinococcus_capsulatus_cf.AAC.28
MTLKCIFNILNKSTLSNYRLSPPPYPSWAGPAGPRARIPGVVEMRGSHAKRERESEREGGGWEWRARQQPGSLWRRRPTPRMLRLSASFPLGGSKSGRGARRRRRSCVAASGSGHMHISWRRAALTGVTGPSAWPRPKAGTRRLRAGGVARTFRAGKG